MSRIPTNRAAVVPSLPVINRGKDIGRRGYKKHRLLCFLYPQDVYGPAARTGASRMSSNQAVPLDGRSKKHSRKMMVTSRLLPVVHWRLSWVQSCVPRTPDEHPDANVEFPGSIFQKPRFAPVSANGSGKMTLSVLIQPV